MANYKTAVKGTLDVLPAESYKWQHIERTMLSTAELYGYKEQRTPVFEYTDLFQRSVGDTTDVVQKEMYTFEDKGGRSITLRPEGTAGAARAFLEHGLFNEALPVKVSYVTSCYRYEKPQAGRLREFHQFGVEAFGAASYLADVETIAVADAVMTAVGVGELKLNINSIGCPTCRGEYQKKLREYFRAYESELCPTCLDRLERNPMRILDCKSNQCKAIAAGAPKILDSLCDECKDHFEGVKKGLDDLGIKYSINPDIVRGLDYYTRTVFEFISDQIGAQGTVCGGGRYDGLVKELGGPQIPALGFAIGLERLIMLLEAQQTEFPKKEVAEIYIASMGTAAAEMAMKLCNDIRAEGFKADCDTMGRGLKAQLKYADKTGAKRTVVIGDTELESGIAVLKNMENGEKKEIKLTMILEELYNQSITEALGKLTESIENKGLLGGIEE